MLKLGMLILGGALVLHARRNKAAADDKSETPDDSDAPGQPGSKSDPLPTLDPALEYLIPGGPSHPGLPGFSDLFGDTLPVHFTHPGEGPVMPTGSLPGVAGNLPSAAQLSAVNNIYKGITGLIPRSLHTEYANMNRLADFKGRLRRKLKFW